jgi:hypothetical protein
MAIMVAYIHGTWRTYLWQSPQMAIAIYKCKLFCGIEFWRPWGSEIISFPPDATRETATTM